MLCSVPSNSFHVHTSFPFMYCKCTKIYDSFRCAPLFIKHYSRSQWNHFILLFAKFSVVFFDRFQITLRCFPANISFLISSLKIKKTSEKQVRKFGGSGKRYDFPMLHNANDDKRYSHHFCGTKFPTTYDSCAGLFCVQFRRTIESAELSQISNDFMICVGR